MANRTKRTDRSTGSYSTVEELDAAVMKMYRTHKFSQGAIAEACGISAGTCSRIVTKNNPEEPQVDLIAMFNELWKITETQEEGEHV